jgi:cytochrome c553
MISTAQFIELAATAGMSRPNDRFDPGARSPRGLLGMGLNPMNAKNSRFWLVMALLCVGSQPAWTGTIEERLAPCLACHGENGQSANPEIPSLGAQASPYLLIQLFLFREKLRRLDLMNDAVKGLSDNDLRAFADTLAKLPPPLPSADPVDPARIERGRGLIRQFRCNICHNADLAGHDNVPRIAGQREDFLVKTMREYKGNVRAGYDASMAEVLQPVSDADILDLAYFVARQR